MKMSYSIYYRKIGAWRWKELKNVLKDGLEGGSRYFLTEEDELFFFSVNAYDFKYPKHRQEVKTYDLSIKAGQPVQRA